MIYIGIFEVLAIYKQNVTRTEGDDQVKILNRFITNRHKQFERKDRWHFEYFSLNAFVNSFN